MSAIARGEANACPGGGEREDNGEGEPEPATGKSASAPATCAEGNALGDPLMVTVATFGRSMGPSKMGSAAGVSPHPQRVNGLVMAR